MEWGGGGEKSPSAPKGQPLPFGAAHIKNNMCLNNKVIKTQMGDHIKDVTPTLGPLAFGCPVRFCHCDSTDPLVFF